MAGYNNQCATCKYKNTCSGAHGTRKCKGYVKN